MPDTTSPAFPAPLSDNCLRDVHRKLSSIRDQLQLDRASEAYRFLCGRNCAPGGNALGEAIKAFKRQFMPKAPQDDSLDSATWTRLSDVAGSTFAEVWQYELDALRARRHQVEDGVQAPPVKSAEQRAQEQDDTVRARHSLTHPRPAHETVHDASGAPLRTRPADEERVIEQAHQDQLAGLAFSGGGIRSATFNLGILQALAELDRLRHFDYLSTVSGGGYIGSWLSKLLKGQSGNLGAVATALSPGTQSVPRQQEADEIRFLRQYSNYLTPRTGLFSADTWAMLATYLRNTLLNLTILGSLLGAALIVPRLLAFAAEAGKYYAPWFAGFGAITALWAVFYIALSISSGPDPVTKQWRHGQEQSRILRYVVAPLLASAFASSVAIWQYSENFVNIWNLIPPTTVHPVLTWLLVPGLAYFSAWALGWLLAQWRNRADSGAPIPWRRGVSEGFGHFLFALMALGAGALALTWSVTELSNWRPARATLNDDGQGMLLVSFGIPFLLSVFGIAMILAIGLVGRMYNDKSREWWSRQGGWTAIVTLATFALTAVSLFAPPFLGWAYFHLDGWVQALIGSAWMGTTLAGLGVGHSNTTRKRDAPAYLDWVAALAPLVFSIGALVFVSTIVYFMMLPAAPPSAWGGAQYAEWTQAFATYFTEAARISPWKAAEVMGALLVVGLFLARRVDINKFSLYMMYRNRLVRAYLGASNPDRNPNPFTGFDENDDVNLDDLLATQGIIQRPYQIINTTLNLVKGKELAWQTRKAGGFAMTPGFCGFELPRMSSASHAQAVHEAERGCFRPTWGYRQQTGASIDEESGVKLGMAMAISGAAASPNMGYHSSPALSFLMTLFNVRLGRWFANPRSEQWSSAAPKFGMKYLLYELFGLTDADSPFVYLSDGGHFENLGIYELVRRRCRLIVVIDASADGQLNFEGLGNAIRKCATDLHIEIDIDANLLLPKPPTVFSQAHCVVGEILYDRTDPKSAKAQNGTLLYIKPSLMSDEYAEVLNYRKTNKDFPHQSTADQWFDETQFESYRSLGYRIGMAVFDLSPPGPPPPPAPAPAGSSAPIPSWAHALKEKWGAKEKEKSPAMATPVEAQTPKESTQGEPATPADSPEPSHAKGG